MRKTILTTFQSYGDAPIAVGVVKDRRTIPALIKSDFEKVLRGFAESDGYLHEGREYKTDIRVSKTESGDYRAYGEITDVAAQAEYDRLPKHMKTEFNYGFIAPKFELDAFYATQEVEEI